MNAPLPFVKPTTVESCNSGPASNGNPPKTEAIPKSLEIFFFLYWQ